MIENIIFRIINILFNRPYLKLKLKHVGDNFRIGYSSEIKNPQYFSIGNNFYSGPYGYFVTNRFVPVSISDDVMFGPFCKIFGGNHDIMFTENHIRFAPEIKVNKTSICVERGAWVGANSLLLNNCYISEGSVIAAGSIVNNFVPPYCIAYGSPARKFKRRFKNTELKAIINNVNSTYSFDELLEIYRNYDVND